MLTKLARERRREPLELEQKGSRGRMQNWRGVRRTNYQKITRQSILSSAPTAAAQGGEGSGKRYRAKIYIERFSRSPAPSSSRCGRRPATPNGVTLKERRATEIIPDNHHYMQSLAQSSTQYRQRDATVATEDRYERRKKKRKAREEGRSGDCPVRESRVFPRNMAGRFVSIRY
jgi:hypothetical protein